MTHTGFDRVLVANRGEIAVRVMRACEELGADTVAVYSDADRGGGHVRYADEAYNIGPARAADSYLDQAAIVDAASRSGADAVHPGYGFLAENADFARRVEAVEGLTWVGPDSDPMERLGEKTRARSVMQSAGVPIVPGTTDPVADPEAVVAFGEEHGYPVAIKAEGGGGGRGMTVVRAADEATDQFESARREGEAYFDDPSVYLERYLEGPRHVEVQILADRHGNVRHLGERDCSLQRRHQKVIEEGPSPALSAPLRERIVEAARRGVDATDYTNAGTVEFLVAEEDRANGEVLGPDADFYFLEVNTRVQVEHCVTEAVTGIDIVKWQLRVAAGEELTFDQDEVEIDGHAVEFRVNAENAAEGFAPAPGGTLETYDPPGGPGVRVDDALRQGDDLVTDYDSLIAKLVVSGQNRAEALERGRRALAEYDIEGVQTVLPFHRLTLTDDRFVAGRHTTDYVDERLDPERVRTAQERWGTESATPADDRTDDTDGTAVRREFTVEVDGKRFEVDLTEHGAPDVDADAVAGGETGTQPRPERTGRSDDTAATTAGGAEITAEMQGTILDVLVTEGDEVAAGEALAVLEAMKMENDVVAETGGTVTEVAVDEGESVEVGERLVVVE